MALNGEVTREIGGKSYTFKLGVNQMIALEKRFSTPEKRVTFQDVIGRAGNGDLEACRAMVQVGLSKYHPEITEEDAGELIDQFGADLGGLMGEIREGASPDPEDIKALGVRQRRPRKTA